MACEKGRINKSVYRSLRDVGASHNEAEEGAQQVESALSTDSSVFFRADSNGIVTVVRLVRAARQRIGTTSHDPKWDDEIDALTYGKSEMVVPILSRLANAEQTARRVETQSLFRTLGAQILGYNRDDLSDAQRKTIDSLINSIESHQQTDPVRLKSAAQFAENIIAMHRYTMPAWMDRRKAEGFHHAVVQFVDLAFNAAPALANPEPVFDFAELGADPDNPHFTRRTPITLAEAITLAGQATELNEQTRMMETIARTIVNHAKKTQQPLTPHVDKVVARIGNNEDLLGAFIAKIGPDLPNDRVDTAWKLIQGMQDEWNVRRSLFGISRKLPAPLRDEAIDFVSVLGDDTRHVLLAELAQGGSEESHRKITQAMIQTTNRIKRDEGLHRLATLIPADMIDAVYAHACHEGLEKTVKEIGYRLSQDRMQEACNAIGNGEYPESVARAMLQGFGSQINESMLRAAFRNQPTLPLINAIADDIPCEMIGEALQIITREAGSEDEAFQHFERLAPALHNDLNASTHALAFVNAMKSDHNKSKGQALIKEHGHPKTSAMT